MNVQETNEVRELTANEIDTVNGGLWFLGALLFAESVALGYVIADSQLPPMFRDL